jgi:hypothetical protein
MEMTAFPSIVIETQTESPPRLKPHSDSFQHYVAFEKCALGCPPNTNTAVAASKTRLGLIHVTTQTGIVTKDNYLRQTIKKEKCPDHS